MLRRLACLLCEKALAQRSERTLQSVFGGETRTVCSSPDDSCRAIGRSERRQQTLEVTIDHSAGGAIERRIAAAVRSAIAIRYYK